MTKREIFERDLGLILERFNRDMSVELLESIWGKVKRYNPSCQHRALNYVFCCSRRFEDIIPDLLDNLKEESGGILDDGDNTRFVDLTKGKN